MIYIDRLCISVWIWCSVYCKNIAAGSFFLWLSPDFFVYTGPCSLSTPRNIARPHQNLGCDCHGQAGNDHPTIEEHPCEENKWEVVGLRREVVQKPSWCGNKGPKDGFVGIPQKCICKCICKFKYKYVYITYIYIYVYQCIHGKAPASFENNPTHRGHSR